MNQTSPKACPPVRVCAYLRVSTDKQANKEDGSLDTQLDRITSFIAARQLEGENWVLAEKIVEGERDGRKRGSSAKSLERPGLQRALELAKAKLVDVVVATKIDRFSRSTVDFLLLVRELHEAGVKVVSIREKIDLTTPAGQLQTTILIALAQWERELISARTKEKVEWRAQKGLPIGPPPIGYRMRDKMYVVDEAFAKHVRACDRLYLHHESSDAVVREFKRLGFRTPRGHAYKLPSICRMLRNLTYAAKISYEGKTSDAQWKPIRSWETHQRIQEIMDGNARRRRSSKREGGEHVYLLQGLLRCANCEHKMTPKPGHGRSGRYYPYYACTNAEKSLGDACPRHYVPADAIDRAVIEFLKKLEMQPELVRRFVQDANALASNTGGKLKDDLSRVREQLASIRARLARLVDSIADYGPKASGSLKERLEGLEIERADLEATEGRLKREIEAETCQILSAQEQVRTLTLFKDLLELNRQHPERIKALLPRFIDFAVWREVKGEGTLEVSLFPKPFVTARDVTLKAMLSELLKRGERAEACGPGKLPVRPRLSFGVPDGIRTRDSLGHNQAL